MIFTMKSGQNERLNIFPRGLFCDTLHDSQGVHGTLDGVVQMC